MSEVKFSKEVVQFGAEHNYSAPGEILVTITLAEYRQLVKENGRADEELRHERTKRYVVEYELDKMKEKVAQLIAKYEQPRLGEMIGNCPNPKKDEERK